MTRLQISAAISIDVRSPGMHVAWRTVEALPGLEATEVQEASEWSSAIADNELEPYAAIEVQPLALEMGQVPSLTIPDSEDAYVEMRATPPPNEGLLVMVESARVVQWYLPTSPPAAVLAGFGAEAGGPTDLHFLVPRSTLARATAIAGFAEGIGGAIVRFFRFKIIGELLGGVVENVVAWLANKVESKHKKEGFRFFEHETDFPYVTEDELQKLTGQRVLLLTHGIFSSLPGAFAGIAAPGNPTLQHLRGIYGRNIIGWDH